MQPRDAFGVLVRAIGLGFFLTGVIDLGHMAIVSLGLPTSSNVPQSETGAAAIFFLIVGTAVMATANHIVRLFYGKN